MNSKPMPERIDDQVHIAKGRTESDGCRRIVYIRSRLGSLEPTIASRQYYERNDGIDQEDVVASVFKSGGEVFAERYEQDTYVPKAYR